VREKNAEREREREREREFERRNFKRLYLVKHNSPC